MAGREDDREAGGCLVGGVGGGRDVVLLARKWG